MQKADFVFTKTTLEALSAAEPGKRSFYRDTKQPGLQLRVTENGVKTFFVRRRRKNGADERITLDKFPAMTVENARAKASIYVADLANGVSVLDIVNKDKGELTFAKLFETYIERHAKPRKRTWQEDQAKYDFHIASSLGKKKLSKITRAEVAGIHDKLTRAGKGTSANRVLALISTVFNKAVEWDLFTGDNPCRAVSRNTEVKRDRFLQSSELPRFFAALAVEPNETIRDYLTMSLLTGARRANVLAMRWIELSIGEAEWRIPRTKNGDSQVVTLGPEAVALLIARKENSQSSFVFPGSGDSGHLEEPKKGWQRVLHRAQALGFVGAVANAEGWGETRREEVTLAALQDPAAALLAYPKESKKHRVEPADFELTDLRIHDLRRTLGSWQAKTGASIAIIGKSLNHKNIATTMIYARLDKDPVRESVARATSAMYEAAGIKTKADVVPIGKAAKRG